MAQFGVVETAKSTGTMGSSSPKATVTPSTTYQLAKTITLTPAPSERVEVTNVSIDLNADTVAGVTLTGGWSAQNGSDAEGSIAQIGGTVSEGGASSDCTNDVNYGNTNLGTTTPQHTGRVGVPVTVRLYEKTSSVVNTNSLCCKNGIVTGRMVEVVNQQLGGQFRGSF